MYCTQGNIPPPPVFFRSLPVGEHKAGKIPKFLSISRLHTTESGRIQGETKLLASLEGRTLQEAKIALYTVIQYQNFNSA